MNVRLCFYLVIWLRSIADSGKQLDGDRSVYQRGVIFSDLRAFLFLILATKKCGISPQDV